jgi:RNA polymerase sigma-70 factor (ECF subfamily)
LALWKVGVDVPTFFSPEGNKLKPQSVKRVEGTGAWPPAGLRVDADRDLVKAAAAGDRDAFDELVRRYQRPIVNLARAMTASDADVDDIAQEVFVRVWRSLAKFRGDSAFRTWLYGIALNVIRTHRGRRSKLRSLFWSAPADSEVDPVEEARDEGTGIEQKLMLRDAIDRALKRLPEELRGALVLRDVQGLEYREISEALGIPIGTVESRIFRARQRLRPLLAHLRSSH